MKLIYENQGPKQVLFSDIKHGEVFEYNDAIFMRIIPRPLSLHSDGIVQIVCLAGNVYYSGGSTYAMDSLTEVWLLDATLNVKKVIGS